jgi:DNA-binding beta-propeller fold protein YncE
MSRILFVALLFLGAVATGQSPQLLVLNKEEATLSIFDAASGKLLGNVTTGEGPHEIVVSDDGKLAYVSNYGTGAAPGQTISVIDLDARKELRRVDIAPLTRPHGLWFTNGKLYFTAETNRRIARYDPASNNIEWQFETGQNGTHMLLVTKDAKTIFTSNIGSDNVSAIQQTGDGTWAQTLIPVGKGPEGIDLSADGRHVWSAHSRDGGVSVIDVAAKKVLQTIDIATKRSNRIKLTPDGKFALVSDLDAGDVIVLDTTARKEIKRLPLGRMVEGILIPDASRAFVAVTGENYVAEIDPKTWAVKRKIAAGKGPDGLAWRR